MILELINSIFLTIILELLVLCFTTLDKRIYFISIPLNAVTNFILNIILLNVLGNNALYIILLIVLEIVVFGVEGFIYYLINRNIEESIKLSVMCNTFSLIFGSLLFYIISLIY